MVIVKKYKNPTVKPGHQKCSCGYIFFYSMDVERILKGGKNTIICNNCKKITIIKAWTIILRKHKLEKIKNNGTRTRKKLD